MKIYTADRETGTFIEECASIDEALAKIEEYEEADKKEGTYEEGFYNVVNECHETLARGGKKMAGMTKEEVKAYMDFMYNRENEWDCEACPHNRGFDDFQSRKPCGQWNCWVTAHCDSREED